MHFLFQKVIAWLAPKTTQNTLERNGKLLSRELQEVYADLVI